LEVKSDYLKFKHELSPLSQRLNCLLKENISIMQILINQILLYLSGYSGLDAPYSS